MEPHDATPPLFGLPQSPLADADLICLPLPFEASVSYGRGTARGPEAILLASHQVETWDDETRVDLETIRFHTCLPITPQAEESPGAYLHRVEAFAVDVLKQMTPGALLVTLGGEHSVTPQMIAAMARANSFGQPQDLTVVQIDAHADLRDQYEGSAHSHACAMRRALDIGGSLVAIGVRSRSREEAEFAATNDRISTYLARDLARLPATWDRLLSHVRNLTGPVYLTIDIDGLCPSLCPGTGTPEPGGLSWWDVTRLIATLFTEAKRAQVVAVDLVEVVPTAGTQVNEFTGARLLAQVAAAWHLTRCRR